MEALRKVMTTRLIKTIQVENKEQLKIAKALKINADRLLDTDIAIGFTEGDISLKLDETVAGLISVDSNKVTITADSLDNLLAVGTQGLLQIYLDQLVEGETVVTYAQKERILMIDMGRKYFPKDVLLKFIDSMSLAQFNYLQLHFSENEGFRIESEVAPEIVSDDYLTKNEIREVIQYANHLGIEIIPDFDTPGHLKQLLKDKPEWQLRKKNADGQLENYPSALNIVNPEAVLFIESLYKEYAELFYGSTYFHIGGDEFVDFDEIDAYPDLKEAAVALFGEQATAMDYFVHYVNQIAEKISSWGFVPRVWNDGFYRLNRKEIVTLSDKVEITYWTKWHQQMAPVETFIDKGYQVLNFNDNYFYYVLGEAAGYTYPTYEKILTDWNPLMYPQSQKVEKITNQLPGVALAVWSDIPDAQEAEVVFEKVSPLLFAISQKENDTKIDLQDTLSIIERIHNN